MLHCLKKKHEKELFGEEFEDGNISFGALERANKGTLPSMKFQRSHLKRKRMF